MLVGTMCPTIGVVINYSSLCLLCLTAVCQSTQQTVIAGSTTDRDCDVIIRDVMSNGSDFAPNCTTVAPPGELQRHRTDTALNTEASSESTTSLQPASLTQQTTSSHMAPSTTSQLFLIYHSAASNMSNTDIKHSNNTNNNSNSNNGRSSPEVDDSDVIYRPHNDAGNTSSLLLTPEDGVVDDVIGDVAEEDPEVMDGKELDRPNYWNNREMKKVENSNQTTITDSRSSNELRDYHVGAEYHNYDLHLSQQLAELGIHDLRGRTISMRWLDEQTHKHQYRLHISRSMFLLLVAIVVTVCVTVVILTVKYRHVCGYAVQCIRTQLTLRRGRWRRTPTADESNTLLANAQV